MTKYRSKKGGTKKFEDTGLYFISKFENKDPDSHFCPGFYQLHQAAGCPYGCSYCYLCMVLCKNVAPRYWYNIFDMAKEVEKWHKEVESPASLNCGSICDALAIDTKYLVNIIPIFGRTNKRVTLTVLTKAGIHTEPALELLGVFPNEPVRNVNFCWTLNPTAVAARYEIGAPTPVERLKLAKKYSDRGWPIRYRIDPMFPIEDWEEHYTTLVQSIAEHWAKPTMITLGTLRAGNGLAKVTDFNIYPPCKDMKPMMEEDRDPGIKKVRVNKTVRVEMYNHVVDDIEKYLGAVPVGLCKETPDVFEEVLGKRKVNICNCQHSCFIKKLSKELEKASAAS